MSRAFRCDRCGGYFMIDASSHRSYITPYGIDDDFHGKDIDLCDDCVESFNKWLKMWEPLKDYIKHDEEAVSNAVECRLENLPEFKPHKTSIITEIPDDLEVEKVEEIGNNAEIVWYKNDCTDDIDIFETGKKNLREAMNEFFIGYDKDRITRPYNAICRRIMPFNSEKRNAWTVADFYFSCRDYKPEYKFGIVIKYHPITRSDLLGFANVGPVIADDIYNFYKWVDTRYNIETAPEPEEATEELPNNIDGLIISEDKIQYFKDAFDKNRDTKFAFLFVRFCSLFGCENTRGQSAERYLNVFLRNTSGISRDSRFLGKENKFYKDMVEYHGYGRLSYNDILKWRGVGPKAAAWINDFVTHYCLYYEKYILEQED